MTHTLPTLTATPRDVADAPQPARPTLGEMLEELGDLGVGLAVGLLPFVVLYVPAIVFFVVLPALVLVVLAAPLVVIAAAIAAPYVLARRLRRRSE